MAHIDFSTCNKMPPNLQHVTKTVCYSVFKSKLTEKLYQSTWGLNSINYDMAKITNKCKKYKYLPAQGLSISLNVSKL